MRARWSVLGVLVSAGILLASDVAAITVPQGESGVLRLRLINDGDMPLDGVTAVWEQVPEWVRPARSSGRVTARVGQAAALMLAFEVHRSAPAALDVPLRFSLVDADGTRWPQTVQLTIVEAPRPDLTSVFPSYPNPFNPETWIPYQLSKAADVVVHIYDVQGTMVRELALGRQEAGWYTSRRDAAYWDGRNRLGERVSSGMYVYHLRAGTYSATGRLLVSK